ncbi:MAG TPA: glycosyl hydrolase, partial [Acidimicrobiia bacterium]
PEQGIDILEGKIGRTLDIDNHYEGEFAFFLKGKNPDGTIQFKPSIQLMEWDRESNRIPLLGWGCGDSHNIVAGQLDDEIDAAALSMKSYGRDFFMRYCWEMDGSRQSLSEVGTPQEFIDAWRYIWNRFKLLSVDNVIWNFSTNAARFKDANSRGKFAWDYYPGDTYVDWVSADGYNWHGAAGRNDRYRQMLEIYDEFMIWARSTGPTTQELRDIDEDFPVTFPNKGAVKPIMVAEYGTQEQADGGTDKGNWFRNAHETVMPRTASTPASCLHCGAYTDIAAMVYFDVSGKSADSEGGWDIETTDLSLAGYKQYANDPWFHQIETLTWGPYTGSTPTPAPTPDPVPTPAPSPTPTPDPATPANPAVGERSGYWMLGSDGKVYAFGDAQAHGNAPLAGASPIGVVAVDVEPTPSGNGYWIVDSTGRVFTQGDAGAFGSVTSPLAFGETVTSLSSTPDGKGYWIFTSRGRALNFGAAVHYGDVSDIKLNAPVLDSIPTPSGRGYYMVAGDGGIFSFGDARFYGSMGAVKLNAPVQSLVPDPDGVGYWLVASDGGVFAFEANFRGSMGDKKLNQPVTGMVPFGNGYLMVAEDGGIFNFSDQPFAGSLGNTPPANPIVAVAPFQG